MPFVQRDQSGGIISSYARPQPGRATEHVRNTDPELIAWQQTNDSAREAAENSRRDEAAAQALAPGDISVLATQLGAVVPVPSRTAEFQALLDRLNV